jgi:hypothetical protein
MLLDRLAGDVEPIGSKLRVGVTDGEAAQYQKLGWDGQLCTDNLGVACDRDLDSAAKTTFGQGQQQGLQKHSHADSVGVAEVAVHANDAR